MKLASLEAIVGKDAMGTHPLLADVPVAQPASIEAANELMKLAQRDGQRLALLGHGSKLGWSILAEKPDFAIQTTKLAGVVEFEAGDGTLTALAGTTMAELESRTSKEGLCVSPRVARPESATLGGTIAAGASGLDRLAHGPGRLHVLGTRALKLDGSLIRSGGNLVKNVTGYDLMRLFGGSFGSLALLVEASLRLMPVPEVTNWLSKPFSDLESCLELASDLLAGDLHPQALLVENATTSGTWKLHAMLAGRGAHVEHLLRKFTPRVGECDTCTGPEASALSEQLRDLTDDLGKTASLHVTSQPSKLRAALGECFDQLGPHEGMGAVIHPGIASVDLGTAARFSTQDLHDLRRRLAPLNAQACLRGTQPLSVDHRQKEADPLRLDLARRLSAKFDPNQLLCTRPPLRAL